jgi:dTDP-4-amino-4,6-dideoxygalactose transaminase
MWHLFPIRVPQDKRKSLFNLLRSEGIIVQVNYLPVYLHPYFLELGYKKGSCPNAELFYETEISLPMHVNLNMRQIERISNIIIKFFKS